MSTNTDSTDAKFARVARRFAHAAEAKPTAQYVSTKDGAFGGVTYVYIGINTAGDTLELRDLASEYNASDVEFLGGPWELRVEFAQEDF